MPDEPPELLVELELLLHVAQLVLRQLASETYAVSLSQDAGGFAEVRQLMQVGSLAHAAPSLQQKSSRQVVQAGIIDVRPQLVAPPAPLELERAPPAPVAPPAPPPHCEAQLVPRQPLNALNAALFAHGVVSPDVMQFVQVVSFAQSAPWLQHELSRHVLQAAMGSLKPQFAPPLPTPPPNPELPTPPPNPELPTPPPLFPPDVLPPRPPLGLPVDEAGVPVVVEPTEAEPPDPASPVPRPWAHAAARGKQRRSKGSLEMRRMAPSMPP
jgi:hypothetical protein